MTKKEKKELRKEQKEKKARKEEAFIDVKFTNKNLIFFAIGIILVVLGFTLLASGSITLAPILLILGYLVFFPLGILWKEFKKPPP